MNLGRLLQLGFGVLPLNYEIIGVRSPNVAHERLAPPSPD